MKIKFIILTTILMLIPRSILANPTSIQNITWKDNYIIEFSEIENASSYQYSFSINNSKVPSKLFSVNNFEHKNNTISFFPEEALKYFGSDTPAVYRVWITALDKDNNPITALTQSDCGKIITSNYVISSMESVNSTQVEEIKKENNEKLDANNETTEKNTTENWINPFEDISENAWYYNSIKFSNQNNLLSGITTTQFGPKNLMTRGMLAQVLYKHSKDDSELNYALLFNDVKESAYYYDAITWICKNNISSGMGKNVFNPNAPITREQLITILYNYSIYLGKNVKSQTMNFSNYEDADTIHSWAKVPLCWALKNNLIAGRTATILAPREATTRAEFATIMMRFLNI